MKRYQLLFVFLAFTLAACGGGAVPEALPTPTEAPAHEASVTEIPTEIRIIFYYDYGDIPENWIENRLESQVVTFERSGDDWERVSLSPVALYHGSLFGINTTYLEHGHGDCPINTYFVNLDNGNKRYDAQPKCKLPGSEESVIARFSLVNCSGDSLGNLACSIGGEFGTLKYSLNSAQDVFEYQYVGSWDLTYEIKIGDSLRSLGFENLPNLRSSEEKKIYTIYKNHEPESTLEQ